VLLSASSIAVVAVALRQPAQAVTVAPPLAVLLLALWLFMRGWPRIGRAIATALALALTLIPLFTPQTRLPGQDLGVPNSTVLWTSALQHPEQSVIRFQPLPGAGDHVLLMRYDWLPAEPHDARLVPMLHATVNGVRLVPQSAVKTEDEYCCERRWPVAREITAGRPWAEIAVSQSPRDARVRLIMQGSTSPAGLGARGTAFFDGLERHFGVPHSASGAIRAGFAHIWLEPAP
jgi:hypothetical protein